jgi:hypothetical protein
MSKHHCHFRVFGLGATALLLSVAACSDDDADSPGNGGGRGGSAGMSMGGSKAGNPSTAGSSPTAGTVHGGSAGTAQGGGSAGKAQGGSAGEGPMTAGGEGGSLGEAGAVLGGAAGSAGDTNSVGGAGATSEGGAGGAGNPDGCDYVETNSDQNEETGLEASAVVQTICGNVNNGDYEPVEGLVDRDGFEVTVPVGTDALFKLEISDPQALVETDVYVNGILTTFAVGGRATFRHRHDNDDVALIALRLINGEDLAAPVPYKLSVVTDDVDERCPASAAAATFSEANDGAESRDNDVYQFDADLVASFTDAADTAEPTAITVGSPPQTYRLNGSSAEVSRNGPYYYDGDSFAFHTGPGVSQLTIRGDWSGDDRDFDMFLFKAGKELEHASAIEGSTVSGEYLTAAVEPDSDYVLWMGLYDGTQPSPYSLTLCGEAFSLTGD